MSLTDALLLDPLVTETWIAARTDGIEGSGSASDPFNGSTATRFDEIMGGLEEGAIVHLGPGTFETQGFYDGMATGGWQAKARMKLRGAGVDATTLRLVPPSGISNKHFFAISHPLSSLVDDIEISDLSIDSNFSATNGSTSNGAIRVMGNHARIERIKAKGWGAGQTGPACFVLSVVTGNPSASILEVFDAGIEECIVVEPGPSHADGIVTLIHAGSPDNVAALAETYGRGAFIRNCFVDAGWPTSPGTFYGLSMNWCRGGIIEANHIHNVTCGGPCQENASTPDIIVRQNFYKNVAIGPNWRLGSPYPSPAMDLLSLASDPTNSKIALATVSSPAADLGLQPGDRLLITASAGTAAQFKGLFVISDVQQNGNQFRYQMSSAPPVGQETAGNPKLQKVFGAGRILVERNTVELAFDGTGLWGIEIEDTGLATQQPAHAHGDIVIRDNRIRFVDGRFESTFAGRGILVQGVDNLIVRNNILEGTQMSLVNQRCGSVNYFNNRTPAGKLIQGYESDLGTNTHELETEVEDAFVLALLNRKSL